jgi:uncharacterized protein YeeX (DUF496 family)
MGLVQTMADSCSFADEAEELKKRSERDRDIINQILRQVMECAHFIRDYCTKSFGMWNLACSTSRLISMAAVKRIMENTVSPMDARIDDYKGTLEALRQNLVDHANIQCSVITHRLLDVGKQVRKYSLKVIGQKAAF